MIILDIIRKEFGGLRNDLIARYRRENRRATGQWENELEVDVSQSGGITSAKLLGADYTEFMVEGRGPGRFPPEAPVLKWLRAKGIDSSAAYPIRLKIAREGTEVWKKGGSDMLESVITEKRLSEIVDRTSEFQLDFTIKEIVKNLKK